MSKELEALEQICDELCKYRNVDANAICKCEINKQRINNCGKCPMYQKENIIETALKDHEKITSGDFHIEPINVHIENQKKLKEHEVMKQTKIIVADKKISDDDLEKLENQGMLTDLQCEIKPLFDEETQKKLKALEIIKEKEVDVFIFLHNGDLETYNDMVEDNRKLTQEEFDLLKEVLL